VNDVQPLKPEKKTFNGSRSPCAEDFMLTDWLIAFRLLASGQADFSDSTVDVDLTSTENCLPCLEELVLLYLGDT